MVAVGRAIGIAAIGGSLLRRYKDLKVWEKAHAFTLAIYKNSPGFPAAEAYGLTRQIRRAASSIAINIAEGCGLGTDAELRQKLQIAMGSASEVDYQLLLTHDLGFLTPAAYRRRTDEVVEIQKMLSSFIVKLRTDLKSAKSPTR